MDEERLKRIRANIAKHEERKKTQNIMGDIDSSKLDRSNASYNKNDAAFEMAKQHYQNSYVPKKAQEYYKGVENYRNSYEQMANKPSANNYTVMTPENESANLIGDGINTYVSPQMREKAQKHYNEVFNNENKKYAEQYARLNEKSKPAYSYAQAKSEAVKKVDNSINAFSSQFKDENEYNAYADNMARAKEQQRLLNYNVAEARNKLLTMKALNMNPSVKVEDTDEYKRIESDMKKAESVQEFAKNMQNEDFRKQYAEYEQHQKDYENKNWLGKTAEQVGNAIADVLYSIGSGAYGVAESVSGVADSVLGRNPNEGGTLSKNIHDFNNYIHNEAERRQRYSSYAKQGLTTDLYNATNNEEFSDITSNVISITLNSLADAGVSMAMAALTGGTSLTQKGLQSTVGLTKTQKAAQTASSMLKGMTKNLNFWTSFAREGGSAYNDAISAGASNEEATIAMLATGLPNAYIEVGGGVEKFKDLAGTGVKGWLRDFAKSTGEEATEELKQGIISELVKKLTYAPETELFSTADDGSGIINPIRMYQEAFGGAVGGAFGGSVGKAINVASYTVANNMYKSDSMRELIQSGKYTEMLKALPDSDFKNSEISKTFSAEMDEKQTLAKLKGISNRQLIKQYDSMVDTLSSVSEGNVASLALIATGDTKTATEVAPILRKLYDGKAITEEEAKIISRNENVVNMLSETTGLDMTNSSWEDFVTLSEQAQFENITGTSTGNAIADVVLGNAQRAEAGRNYIAEEQNKYANDLSGTPTFTAQIGDESVKITSIDHVENGEVYVNLSNGTTQEAQSLNTDEVTTALLSYASEYDAKTASAFIGGYTGNISVGEYARSFAGVNSAAKAGISYDNIVKSAPTMIKNVGIDTAKTLTKSGNAVALKQATADIENTVSAQQRQATRNDKTSVKNKTGGTVTREHRILARTVSKVTGYTVVLVDSTNVKNGKTVNGRKAIGEFNSTKGEIVLDIGSDDVVATTLHEVTHYIKLNAPTQYNALRDAVIEYATKTGKIEYYLEKYANSYGTDNVYELTEEMTADAAEALLTNEKFISELLSDKSFVNAVVGENKGFVRKFLDTLHDIISSIKDYLKGRTVNHQIARELSEDVKALEKIEKLWRDALTAAVNNHAESSAVKQDTKKSADKSGTKFSITEDMSEQERYEELKDKSIVVSKPDMSKVSNIDIEAYKNLSTKEAKKPIRRIAEMLGIHNVNYKNSNIKFDFAFSKGSLDTSLNHQREYGGNYTDYAEMLTCLEKLIENAELIEVHKNYKNNEYLKNTFVLISAINNDGNITPVQLEVKEYDKGQSNSLYLNVVLSKIKESAVIKGEHNGNADISNPLVADSTISLSQLFANVNPSDKRFLKYVPDNFLSTEQIEAKREAQKSDYKNYNRYVEVFKNDKDGSDNKFSLSEPVEEKDNLIAVHNIYTDKLVKSLKLGGFPMPSIAVIKSDMGHGNYGECSFVFDKSTIDPKADKRNKVYGGDVWSPTYPKLAYKANEKIADKARKKYYDLYERHGEKVRGMYRYAVTLEDALNSKDGKNNGGEQKMLDKLYNDVGMMQIYRLDHGEDVIGNVVKREEEQTLNEQEIALSKQLLSTFENRIEEIAAKNGENPLSVKKEFFNKYHDEVIEAFKKYYRSTGMSIEEAEAKVANTKTFTFVSSLAKALKYKHNKGITVTEDIDYEATDKAIRDSVDQSEYREWIDSLIKGAEEKRGIWNGKDFYTPSGKMRNFDALHYEETLENVVKAMRSDMNGDTLFGGMGIWGVAQKEYSSINKLKSDSARLQKMSDDEYSNIKSGFAEQLSEVTKAIKTDYSGNDFIDSDIVAGNIVNAVRESKTKSGIKSYLKEYYPDITDTAVDDIVNLVHGIMEMPTGYFEAKPQRAVRFDEVKYAVVPETLDENIKKQLADYGIQIVEYEDGKVINENRIARAELRKAERAKAKAFYDDKLKALRDEKNEAIAKLRKEKNDKYDNDIKNLRDAKDKKLKEVRADRDEKLKALRERYREQQREKRENAAKSELRARITAEYKKLYKDLTSNSKEHHIPEVYKETVANVLANIDLISKASKEKAAKTGEVTKVAEKLNNQLTALENFILNYSMYGNKDDGSSNEQLYNFDPDLISNIKKMKEYFGRYANSGVKAVSDMNTEELEALHNMLKALRYAVRTADKALSANITQRISTLAESSIAEMATDKTRNPFNKNKAAQVVGAVDTYINSQMLDARSYYNGMGNSAFEIYKAFRSGLNSFIKHTHEAQNYFAKVRKDSGYTDKQIKHLVDDYKTYTVSHGEIAMSRAQLMSLYCLSKREQALEHIYKGGIRPTDLKGKRQIKPVMISPDELSSLLKNLNSTEIAMADRLQQFMATTCAEWGNEVSMAMYGYAKFTERNYFPIKSSDTKIRTNDQNSGGDTGLYSVLNYGMTKSLVKNANNSIDVGDIFSVTRQHIEEMSSYSAYAGAVADGMRWFNYNNRETGESVKQSMLNKFGTNGSKYFIELVRDINRNKPTGNYGGEISSVLTSAQKAAAIAGNLSVVVQQPTAIARACTELSLDLITEGIAISATHIKKSVQEAQAHSEIAWWKSQGFFETNMSKSMDEIITGRSTAKDKIVEMAMKPAGLADDVTWGAIWEATKLWTKKYHPEVKVNSEEFYSITKEKFDDVVDQTQVVDSVLHRPMILRSKNALVKMDMSFMAEPLKSANLLRNAIVDVKNKKPNATKRLIRVYASCVMANVLAAAAKAIVMAFRDTGDDEWWEKWFSSFSSDLLSTLNPLSIIPFVKDIFSVLDGYDVERMDMSAVTGIIQFVQQAVEYAQKDNLDKALNLQSAYKLTRYLSQLTGLPVYNVLREIDTIIDIFGDPIFRASQATPATERYEALYNAVMKNDEAEMQNEYDRLGKTQKEIEQRLKSKIIDDSKGNKMFNADVDKAAKARISGDVKTAVEIVRNLADTTALSKDFWTACVNARANKISKAQENRTQLIEAGISKLTVDNMSDTEVNEALKSYETEADTSTASDLNEDTNTESLYTADDLVKALQDGNESDYNTAYDDMVSTKAVSLIMQAEADNKELTADEAEEKAESSIKSAITKVLKPLMRELYKTDKKKFNEMRKKIIKKFGYTSKQITKWLASEE